MTSVAFNLHGDLPQLADGNEAITLTWPTGRQQALEGAVRTAVRRQAVQGRGRTAIAQTLWHLPAQALAAPPVLGMLITDAQGENWTVMDLTLAAASSRWTLTTRQAAIQGRLADRVHVQVATLTKDAHGGQVATWRTVAANLPARMQPLERPLRAADGIVSKPRYHIILPPLPQGALRWKDRPLRIMQPQTKKLFDVTSIETPETLADFLVLTAEGG